MKPIITKVRGNAKSNGVQSKTKILSKSNIATYKNLSKMGVSDNGINSMVKSGGPQSQGWIQSPIPQAQPIPMPNITYLPPELKKLPLYDLGGEPMILDIKIIRVKGIKYPYNAAILKNLDGTGYHLFFRHDIYHKDKNPKIKLPYYPMIGYTLLNLEFKQISSIGVKLVNTRSHFSEDPRVIQNELGEVLLIYNDLISEVPNVRTIHLANLGINSNHLGEVNSTGEGAVSSDLAVSVSGGLSTSEIHPKYITNLDQHIQPIEKNWSPFIYSSGGGGVHFQYHMNPHKILALPNPRESKMEHLTHPSHLFLLTKHWDKWGVPRGSTPAELYKGEYLAFFHSHFKSVWSGDVITGKEKEKYKNTAAEYYYVFGAYTFAAEPPFQITKMSPHPILFSNVYNSPYNPKLNHKRIIYPSGMVITLNSGGEVPLGQRYSGGGEVPQGQRYSNGGGSDLIHISCGENDSAIKIITFQADRLLKSLIEVN